MGHDIYPQVDVPIFLSDVMQAKAFKTTESLVADWEGAWPGAARYSREGFQL